MPGQAQTVAIIFWAEGVGNEYNPADGDKRNSCLRVVDMVSCFGRSSRWGWGIGALAAAIFTSIQVASGVSGFQNQVTQSERNGLVKDRPQEGESTNKQDAGKDYQPIAAARTTSTGLLLEPDLDLTGFTKERFVAEMETVGKERIRRPWKSPVQTLPARDAARPKGLTEEEVQQYMLQVKQLFLEGRAIPVSDVGLISTQEDVIRQPMLNHIAAFENEAVRVYLLVQRTLSDDDWSYFSIVQDLTLDTPLDYYAQVFEDRVNFEGTSCYKCHSSGPLAIHPAREDLVLDAKLAAGLSQWIANQPVSQFHFPEHSPKPETGKPLQLSFCTECHDEGADRSPLFQVHAHPIRILVDYGYMPPDRRLTAEEIQQLQKWLDEKPEE